MRQFCNDTTLICRLREISNRDMNELVIIAKEDEKAWKKDRGQLETGKMTEIGSKAPSLSYDHITSYVSNVVVDAKQVAV